MVKTMEMIKRDKNGKASVNGKYASQVKGALTEKFAEGLEGYNRAKDGVFFKELDEQDGVKVFATITFAATTSNPIATKKVSTEDSIEIDV